MPRRNHAPDADDAPPDPARLRRFNQVIAGLLDRQRRVLFTRPADALARLTEAAAEGLEVRRASVWLYDETRTRIRCVDLFVDGAGHTTSGLELDASGFPAYFAALQTERAIAAHDAHQDPRTAEFSAPYLRPLGIGAMLDVPLWVGGVMVGVMCHEHVGGPRRWTRDEEDFATAMAGFVALAEERRRAREEPGNS